MPRFPGPLRCRTVCSAGRERIRGETASDAAELSLSAIDSIARCQHSRHAAFGRNGTFRARRAPIGPRRRSPTMRHGGRRGSPGSRRSTPRSPRPPRSNCSTTGPTPTVAGCASPAHSRSRACRRTASPPPPSTSWSRTSTSPRGSAGGPACRRSQYGYAVRLRGPIMLHLPARPEGDGVKLTLALSAGDRGRG